MTREALHGLCHETFPSLLLATYYQFLIVFPSCLRHDPPLPALSLTKQPWHSLTRNGSSDVLPCLASWYFLNDKRHAPADLQEEIDIIEARETFLTNKVCPRKCFPLTTTRPVESVSSGWDTPCLNIYIYIFLFLNIYIYIKNAPYHKHPEVDRFKLGLFQGNDLKKNKERPKHILPIFPL